MQTLRMSVVLRRLKYIMTGRQLQRRRAVAPRIHPLGAEWARRMAMGLGRCNPGARREPGCRVGR